MFHTKQLEDSLFLHEAGKGVNKVTKKCPSKAPIATVNK